MRPIRAWLLRFSNSFRKSRTDHEFEAEMRSHLELHIRDNLRAGMSPEEARRQALLRLGGVEQTKELYRDRRSLPAVEIFLRDLRFAGRMLRKNPAVTAIVVLTLAVGIGANTAIFSLVNGFLLRRMPVPEPEQIAALVIQDNGSPLGALGFSYPQFSEFRAQAASFCEVFGQALGRVTVTSNGHSETLAVSAVSSNYFSTLGVKPGVGRLMLPGEGEKPGEQAVLVLGYSFWQKRFGGDPAIVGKQVRADGKLATIIGVVPKEFRGQFSIFEMDAYLPLSTMFPEQSPNSFWSSRSSHLMLSLGRLKPGITLTQAQSGFDVISQRLAAQYPATDRNIRVLAVDERLSRPIPYANNAFIMISILFLVLAALVLLLACANIANILMARASVRSREMAIRAALGGVRSRLVRQMLTETTLTAAVGGIAGIILGVWLSQLLGLIHISGLPIRLDFSFDWRVFTYAFMAVLFTAIFAGLSPALRATRTNVNADLHQGGPANAASGSRHRVRADLMAAQVAGSLMLLVVAGLFVRSLQALQYVDLGFDPDHLLNAAMDSSLTNHTESQTNEFYRALETKIRALPGVESASLAASVPMVNVLGKHSVYIEGHPIATGQQAPGCFYNSVDSPYFITLRIPLLLGRTFTEADGETSQRIAIVNETMARQFWPRENPIGKRFSLTGDSGPFVEVVGMVRDGKYRTLADDPQPYFYLPLKQDFTPARILQIRSSVPPESLIPQVQREILALDPGDPLVEIQTMRESLNGALGFFIFRLGASLAAVLGLIGLLLAVIGVYGVVSYAAAQRTQELGIRTALGASPSQILRLLLKQGIQLLAGGLIFGLAGAWALTRAMSHMLVGVSPSDPLTYLAVSALLTLVTLFACWIPARRAMRVDPIIALRYE